MFEKLEQTEKLYRELEQKLADPGLPARQEEWKKLSKQHAELGPVVEKYREYRAVQTERGELEAMLAGEKDPELAELTRDELRAAEEKLAALEEELKILLLPKDPNDDKNVILEIRAGAGGEEAALFALDLLKMYLRYAEKNRWKTEEIDLSSSDLGGIKEAVVQITGKGAYSKLKFESGVHRVQRVPETESQGRIHTSTVTVAVLPEAEDVEVQVDEKDLRIDIFRSSGAGGQKVNKTESAIRITHIPTGIVVQCQDERSQTRNKEKAMTVLKSRLYDYYATRAEAEVAQKRRTQVGTGDRSERIRTYNFPQGRVTDHRINMTLYSLDTYMQGEIDEMIDALSLADRNLKLQAEA